MSIYQGGTKPYPEWEEEQQKLKIRTRPVGSKATLNGKPVVWAGPDYGWQSPESFKKLDDAEYFAPTEHLARTGLKVLNKLEPVGDFIGKVGQGLYEAFVEPYQGPLQKQIMTNTVETLAAVPEVIGYGADKLTPQGAVGPATSLFIGAAGQQFLESKLPFGKFIPTGKLKHTTSLSSKYTKKEWLARARKLHVEDGLSMAEVRKQIGQFWVDPESGNQFAIHTHRGKDVDLISGDVRKKRGAKRTKTTKINREALVSLAEKYNQPPEIVDEFLKLQRTRKKDLDELIKRINTRVKANPNVYSEDAIASLGHGKGAFRYPHSADVASNLDLEPHRLNVTRSNKDEISDAFNRALGRSTDLEEEFLKFMDPDLGEFHSKAFELGRHQKDKIIDYVVNNMSKDINWEQYIDDFTGQQLFRSKEEFLIHEALELFSRVRLEEDGLKRIGNQLTKDL